MPGCCRLAGSERSGTVGDGMKLEPALAEVMQKETRGSLGAPTVIDRTLGLIE